MFKVGSAARCLFIRRGFISAVYFIFFCGTYADLLTAAGIYRAISEYRHDARSLRWSLQTHLGRYVCIDTYIYIFFFLLELQPEARRRLGAEWMRRFNKEKLIRTVRTVRAAARKREEAPD